MCVEMVERLKLKIKHFEALEKRSRHVNLTVAIVVYPFFFYFSLCDNADLAPKLNGHVSVLNVPTPPLGPLNAKDIHPEGCILVWSPPEDDGGSEIIGYIVEKMERSRAVWESVGKFSGCVAEVKELIVGKRYLFRVSAVNVVGESKTLEGDRQVTARDQCGKNTLCGLSFYEWHMSFYEWHNESEKRFSTYFHLCRT